MRFILQLTSSHQICLDTVVYIDGFNFYYSLKNTPYKWLDLQKLIENILDSSLHKIQSIKYFTAVPKRASSAQRQDVYMRALKTLQNIEIIFGQFKRRQVKGKSIKENKIITVTKWEEKKSDVNIASHIIYDCCKKKIDCIALLSNDTDLTTPLEFVKYRLKKKIVIITPTKRLDNPKDSIHPNKSHVELKKLSQVHLSIKECHLKNSQFSDVVNGISKPKKW